MLRLGTLSTLLALAAVVVSTQGCAAGGSEDQAAAGDALSATSSSADTLIDIPFYFAVPKTEVTVALNRDAYSYPTLWNKSIGNENAGLRMIAIQQAGQSPSQKVAPRLDMGRQLGKSGVMQTGDIALTFRPGLANTIPYPHIQMGVTHTSLVYVKNGEALHIDSPLDDATTGDGHFTTTHFVGGDPTAPADHGVDAIQIVRPRNLTDARKVNLQSWIDKLAAKRLQIKQQVSFQKDYLTPVFASHNLTTQQTVTKLGEIILRNDTTSDLGMYCSELAWHMLALSNCSEQEILDAPAEGASCVAPIFAPMPLVGDGRSVGLGEGPLRMIETAPQAGQAALVPQVFATSGRNPSDLSSGHREVNKKLTDAGVIGGLNQYYTGKIGNASPALLDGISSKMNGGITPNYSPTAFMIQALMDSDIRATDYVATVVFVDSAADMAKAKSISASVALP